VPEVHAVADAAASSLAAIQRVGGAEVGDCTLVDALAPAVEAFKTAADKPDSPFTTAADAAIDGALNTAALAPRRGRASYVGEHAIGVADPGALGVALLFSALAQVYEPATATRLPDALRITAR
jgi:dihydroxyacetone kinase